MKKFGSSKGIAFPKGDAREMRGPASPVRKGWAEASQKIAGSGDVALVMGEFGNATDREMEW
jgi:antitoxin MazE